MNPHKTHVFIVCHTKYNEIQNHKATTYPCMEQLPEPTATSPSPSDS